MLTGTSPGGPDFDSLVALGHTPDSFARTLLAEALHELAERDGPPENQTIDLTVSVRPAVRPDADEAPDWSLVEICIHTSPGHSVCIVWPPIVVHGAKGPRQ